MKGKRKLVRKNVNFYEFILFFVTIIIFFLLLTSTRAKYVAKLQDTHTIESLPFYFKSSLASVNGLNFDDGKWDGKEPNIIEFDVSNYENTYLITKKDIQFTIEAEKINDTNNDINVQIYDKDNAITDNQILNGDAKTTKKYKLKITKNGAKLSQDSYEIKLKICSLSPYKEELIGNITIRKEKINDNIDSSITDNGEYITLNLNVNDALSNKTISYNNKKLTLDMANTLLDTSSISANGNQNMFSISSSKFELETNYKIIFVKTNESDEIKLGTDIIVK